MADEDSQIGVEVNNLKKANPANVFTQTHINNVIIRILRTLGDGDKVRYLVFVRLDDIFRHTARTSLRAYVPLPEKFDGRNVIWTMKKSDYGSGREVLSSADTGSDKSQFSFMLFHEAVEFLREVFGKNTEIGNPRWGGYLPAIKFTHEGCDHTLFDNSTADPPLPAWLAPNFPAYLRLCRNSLDIDHLTSLATVGEEPRISTHRLWKSAFKKYSCVWTDKENVVWQVAEQRQITTPQGCRTFVCGPYASCIMHSGPELKMHMFDLLDDSKAADAAPDEEIMVNPERPKGDTWAHAWLTSRCQIASVIATIPVCYVIFWPNTEIKQFKMPPQEEDVDIDTLEVQLRVVEDLLAVTVHQKEDYDEAHTWWCYDLISGAHLGKIQLAMPLLVIPRSNPFSLVGWTEETGTLHIKDVAGRSFARKLPFNRADGNHLARDGADLDTILKSTAIVVSKFTTGDEGLAGWVLHDIKTGESYSMKAPFLATASDFAGLRQSILVAINKAGIVFVDVADAEARLSGEFEIRRVVKFSVPMVHNYAFVDVWRDTIVNEHECDDPDQLSYRFYRPHVKFGDDS